MNPKAWLISMVATLAVGAGSTHAEGTKPVATANIACAWSLYTVVQVFENICHAGENNEYRIGLDDAVRRLETRVDEWSLVEVDKVKKTVVPLILERVVKDPEQCHRGDLFDLAQRARSQGPNLIRKLVSEVLAVPRDNQINGCL
jgi:hypothetical protein